ncbi:MAG: hypothetical protein ACI90U_002775 [Pseudomonadales bacterium]|jgi:uncharacterized protein YbjQ (UPF0145 family)
MKGLIAVFVSGVMLAVPAIADEIKEFSIDDIMSSVRAKEALQDDITFSYAGQEYTEAANILLEATTLQTTNGFLKSDRNACELAFIAAMKELKSIAVAKGGNALVDIRSSLSADSVEREDGTYGCISKTTVAEVSLTGSVAILAD